MQQEAKPSARPNNSWIVDYTGVKLYEYLIFILDSSCIYISGNRTTAKSVTIINVEKHNYLGNVILKAIFLM